MKIVKQKEYSSIADGNAKLMDMKVNKAISQKIGNWHTSRSMYTSLRHIYQKMFHSVTRTGSNLFREALFIIDKN